MKRVMYPVLLMLLAVPHLLHAAARNPDSVFGVICPWGGIKDAGIKWVRCGAGCSALDWGAIEKERGVFVWEDADNEVNNTIKNEGVDLLPILGYTPKWASSGPNGENAYPPKDLKDWSNFVYRMVDRYKDRVKYWEVWNEPDIGFWKGTIEEYTDLLKSAYVAAKKADPDCKIVFGGTAGINLPFVESVYQSGGKHYFDVMACHPYQWGDTFNDEWFALQLRNLHQFMAKYGDGGKEIWLTEFGWSTADQGITNEVQARLLAQGFITAFTLGDANVTKSFWFCVKDWGGPNHGLIAHDGARKPSFNAYRWVSGVFAGTEYVRPYKHDKVRAHFFRKDGKAMLAVWSPDKDVHLMLLPEGFKWTRIARLMGDAQGLTQSRISVGPEPLVVYSETPVPAPKKAVAKLAVSPCKLDIWYSVQVQEGTTRLYVVRGRESVIRVRVHNDSPKTAKVELEGRIGRIIGKAEPVTLAPGEAKPVEIRMSLPAAYKCGPDTLRVTGRVGDASLAPANLKVRVSEGPSIEFPANSTVEGLYLVEDEGSAGAPSVRFNGSWTYKFDLSRARGGRLDLCVGAHNANEWRVLLSSDGKTWTTALSGQSNRSWHTVSVTPYSGGPLYVKFEGNDQQLSELVLTSRTL